MCPASFRLGEGSTARGSSGLDFAGSVIDGVDAFGDDLRVACAGYLGVEAARAEGPRKGERPTAGQSTVGLRGSEPTATLGNGASGRPI